MSTEDTVPTACTICLDDKELPLPIQCGCGCRGASAYAHVACKAAYAAHQGPGWHKAWFACPTCEQDYTGAMQLGLAETLWERESDKPKQNDGRLRAQNLLAVAYLAAGRFDEAEAIWSEIMVSWHPNHSWFNHKDTLNVASNLGNLFNRTKQYKRAEKLLCICLERKQVLCGRRHRDTITTAGSLAQAMQGNGKYTRAVRLLYWVIEATKDTDDEASELYFSCPLAENLDMLGWHDEAEQVANDASDRANRMLGRDHPTSIDLQRMCDTLDQEDFFPTY